MPKTRLSKAEEQAFQQDYSAMSARTGLAPNPDDKEHYYDYRGVWKDTPADIKGPMLNKHNFGPDLKTSHWPSKYKEKNHPRKNINGRDTSTGRGTGPRKDMIYE